MSASAEVQGAGATKDKEGWYQNIYKEMWQQYIHEDQTLEKRNNTFLAVQAGMLVILGGVAKTFIDARVWEISGFEKLAVPAIGIVIVIFGLFGAKLVRDWMEVTEVAGSFVRLRTLTLVNIEELAGLTDKEGAAMIEYKWRRAAWDDPDAEKFTPFPQSNLLGNETLSRTGRGAYNITLSNARTVERVWKLIIVIGAVITVVSIR